MVESEFLWEVRTHVVDGEFSENGTYEGTYTVNEIDDRFSRFTVMNVPRSPRFQTFCLKDELMITDSEGEVVSFYRGDRVPVITNIPKSKIDLAVTVKVDDSTEAERIKKIISQALLDAGINKDNFKLSQIKEII